MGKRKRRKVQIGDIIEIRTKKGLAYAQYTHNDQELMGELIRVLPGFHRKRPENLNALARRKTQFFVFVGVQWAVNKGYLSVAGNAEIPPKCREFPHFRSPLATDHEGNVLRWSIHNGKSDGLGEVVDRLTPAQRKLSIWQGCPVMPLIEMIESRYTPEKEY